MLELQGKDVCLSVHLQTSIELCLCAVLDAGWQWWGHTGQAAGVSTPCSFCLHCDLTIAGLGAVASGDGLVLVLGLLCRPKGPASLVPVEIPGLRSRSSMF